MPERFRMRQEQLDQFLVRDDETLARAIARFLHDEVPALIEHLEEEILLEMIATGIVKARRYGLERPEQLIGFVSIMFEIAPNFDEQPDIRAALTDPERAPTERYERLFSDPFAAAWEEADANYDDDAWFPELADRSGNGV